MSPSELGEFLKPFVFLDFFDHDGASFNAPLYPNSDSATLSYLTARSTISMDLLNGPGHCHSITRILGC